MTRRDAADYIRWHEQMCRRLKYLAAAGAAALLWWVLT